MQRLNHILNPSVAFVLNLTAALKYCQAESGAELELQGGTRGGGGPPRSPSLKTALK